MTLALRHRGPDGQGVTVLAGGAILGHTRLAILDLSTSADQPMQNESGTIALAFNGEIYNHYLLRRAMAADGVRFRSSGDTEVLLRCLERSWDHSLVEIDGMFAFAAFDVRRKRLLLARDRLGKKPLYIFRERGALLFASELASLRAAGVELRLDRTQLPHFLVRGYVPAPATLCTGVQQIGPGEMLAIDGGGEETRGQYWLHPWLRNGVPAPVTTDVAGACTTIRRLFREAVERRLTADVPLGAFLSGGVDSTAVVAVAQEILGRPLQTFTLGFEGAAGWDETKAARETAAHLGTVHTERILRPDSLDVLSGLIRLTGEPQGDSSLVPTYLVSRLARERVKVVLTGDGGDEIFAGYDRFLMGYASSLVPRAISARLGRWSLGLGEGPNTPRLLRRAQRLTRAVALGPAATLMEWSGGVRIDEVAGLLGQRLDANQMAQPEVIAYSLARRNGSGRLHALLAANIATYLPGDILVKLDRASMATGLEARSPLLDIRLLEYCASLAPWLLARGLNLKWIFKRALAPWVPRFISRRPKRGFGAPVGLWLRGPTGTEAASRLLAPDSPLLGVVDRQCLEQFLITHRSGSDEHGITLWRLLVLDEWLRNLANPSPYERAVPYGAINPEAYA